MPPHGPGFSGALHSHDPEFPDEDWNLDANWDREATTALNTETPDKAAGIFKPFARRLNAAPCLESDADEELMVIANFGDSPVHIRKLMVIGGGAEGQQGADTHPNKLRCYVNRTDLDFSCIDDYPVAQEFDLAVNADGTVELLTSLREFTNVYTCAFFFPSNFGGGDKTQVRYIGMQGEHTHYRREAVNAEYEVLCNGQDIEHHDDGHKPGIAEPHLH